MIYKNNEYNFLQIGKIGIGHIIARFQVVELCEKKSDKETHGTFLTSQIDTVFSALPVKLYCLV